MAKRKASRPKAKATRSRKPAPRRSPRPKGPSAKSAPAPRTESYKHPDATSPLRPEVGTQAQFKKRKPPATYRYDSSLAPALEWDGQNAARDLGQWLIARVEEAARLRADANGGHVFPAPREFKDGRGRVVATVRSLADAVEQLKRLEKPFLNWAGKAERLSFDVPTLPLFVHERLSTKAILETLKGHKRDKQMSMADLFGDPQHPVADQVLKAYEHADKWTNRMVLGDSLVVMNSLLKYEGLGGQVQMIYMDPPYGINYGSNFQPFVRKRDVVHNDDEDMTREPEMVKAYRDTWQFGVHSYLGYLRDRLTLARDLLHPSGSMFVQISDDNLHHVRELLDEVFGSESFIGMISFQTKIPLGTTFMPGLCDYLLWYARDPERLKFRRLFVPRRQGVESQFGMVELPSAERRGLSSEERANPGLLPPGSRLFTSLDLSSSGRTESCVFPFDYKGKTFNPTAGKSWKTNKIGMTRLAAAKRLHATANALRYVQYLDDFPLMELGNIWTDTVGATGKVYVVQTPTTAIQRCMLMATDPGDLVLDPTCGSGTTAFVAEQWGRRWITADTSRVPLALARQRLLTATFPYYELVDEARGPAGGFRYRRKKNRAGDECGGVMPYTTLGSIAQEEPSGERVLVDRPDEVGGVTRVTGPFVVEATIPTPMAWDEEGTKAIGHDSTQGDDFGSFVERMIEVLRRSPLLHLGGNKTVTLKNIRPPAKTLSLSAEALLDENSKGVPPTQRHMEEIGRGRPVAIVFGPESGAVSEKLVYEAAKEAGAKSYAHLYVIGFAIQPNARKLVDECDGVFGIPGTYVQATPDLMMGDLLKNMRSSQIFSVCGLPEVRLRRADAAELKKMGVEGAEAKRWLQAELLGLDVFDPATMETDHRPGSDVPCWMIDSDYNGLCFRATQVFFPRTAAWDDLRRALKAEYAETVWEHLAGTVSTPFEPGQHGQVAVKVIDDRGNELLVVKGIEEAT